MTTRAVSEGVLPYLAALHRDMPNRAAIRREAAAAGLIHLKLLERVADVMNSLDVPWAALKGLELAHRLYDDPADRAVGDCDVIVREQDFDRAAGALAAAGFQQSTYHRELFVGTSGQVDLHTSFINKERIKSRESASAGEQRKGAGPRGRDLPASRWHERTILLPLEKSAGMSRPMSGMSSPVGTAIPVLCEEDLARYLALHMIHHHGLVGARWLTDIFRLIQKNPRLIPIIGEGGKNEQLLLAMVGQFFKVDTGFQIGRSLFEKIVFQASYEGADVPGLRFLLTLRDISGPGARMTFLSETIFPRRATLKSAALKSRKPPLTAHLQNLTRTAWELVRLALRVRK